MESIQYSGSYEDEDEAIQEKFRQQQKEANALLADPNVHTPTLEEVDANKESNSG